MLFVQEEVDQLHCIKKYYYGYNCINLLLMKMLIFLYKRMLSFLTYSHILEIVDKVK